MRPCTPLAGKFRSGDGSAESAPVTQPGAALGARLAYKEDAAASVALE
ncbi:MAG: hypothetical protein P4L40_01880 [Terracidiphilus sp.]|nr:hypothetical protein [Terracidiphilus sp.]